MDSVYNISYNTILILLIKQIIENKKHNVKTYISSLINNLISDICIKNLNPYEFKEKMVEIDELINIMHLRILLDVYNNRHIMPNRHNIKYLNIFTNKHFNKEFLYKEDCLQSFETGIELFNITDTNINEVNNSLIELFNLLLNGNKYETINDVIHAHGLKDNIT